jgi:nitroimidazol reductase NimA-like FMN-containing flavoprotein (pyridoxamine 5'-phosphate oxidase superfamily)
MTGTPSLTRGDCLRLIGAGGLGRVVFTDAAMPAVQPVAFVLDGDEAVFRVPRGGPLDAATRGTVVGFQVDDIDPGTQAGWSVLAVGRAYEVTDRGRLTVFAAGWGGDGTAHTVAVPLERLSGQRIRLRWAR